MSGEYFEYSKWRIEEIAQKISEEIADNDKPFDGMFSTENFSGQRYSEKTIAEFKNALEILRQAYIYTRRIDYLLACDDGEEDFNRRLKEELENFKFEND